MRVSPGTRLVAAAVLIGSATAHAATPSFEAAFPTRAAPRAFHARVLYRGTDGVHRLELWRADDRLLRRDVDGRLTTVATHRAGDPAYRLDLFDHRRRIHSVVDRDSLYRQGRFVDWAGLAHGLRHPIGGYTVRPVAVRPPIAPVAPCRWYALATGGQDSLICWSAAEAFPLLILDGSHRPVWRVLARDHRPIGAGLFRPDARGYVLNDAAADMGGD